MAEGGNREGGEEGLKILCWNVYGLKNKDDDFWEYIEKFDIIILLETWLMQNEWIYKEKKKLAEKYKWVNQLATKIKTYGRGSGGILVGVRNPTITLEWPEQESTGIVEIEVTIRSECWKIIAIYNRSGGEGLLKELEKKLEATEKRKMMVLGDFNARTGDIQSITQEKKRGQRRSEDKTIDEQGKRLLKLIGKYKLRILNGDKKGDEEGEFTFVGTRSVRDYAICNEITWEKIKKFEVVDRTESEHLPLVLVLERVTEDLKVIFWSVDRRDIENEGFRNYVQEFHIIILIGRWVDGKDYSFMQTNMSDYNWVPQSAVREKTGNRKASIGILVGVKNSLERVGTWKDNNGSGAILESEVKIDSKHWKIIAVYNQRGKKWVLEALGKRLQEIKGKEMMVLGDFNARIKNEGNITWGGLERQRQSKDEIIDEPGKYLLKEIIEKYDLGILNGNKEGDEEGKLTYVPRGKSVVDYAICNKKTWEEIKEFQVVDRTLSDHLPLEIVLKNRSPGERMISKVVRFILLFTRGFAPARFAPRSFGASRLTPSPKNTIRN